jgi:ubiquinone/menaquinone biosynthesis C-methylase UbiE
MSEASTDESAPIINENPALQSYYESLESRIGYRLLLGGTRHFPYYEHAWSFPFPISPRLRVMEDKMYQNMNLPKGSQVLDAGCGVGHVALFMARKGWRITGIDIIDHHLAKARRNIERSGLPKGQVTVQKMDYHHLEKIPDESHDGTYTMETLVHATDPEAVLAGFYRILKPGGRVALFEYDHNMPVEDKSGKANMQNWADQVNSLAAMPTLTRSEQGFFEQKLREAGFENVEVRDYSENVRPILRVFYVLAVVPMFFIRLLHLQKYFANAIAGEQAYSYRSHWRFVAITATKPGGEIETPKTK